jgi:hypothetical protein
MKLLPAPRFHIMTPDEIRRSTLKIWADQRISNLENLLCDVQSDLSAAKIYRDKLHDAGIYSKTFFEGKMRQLAIEMYYQQ